MTRILLFSVALLVFLPGNAQYKTGFRELKEFDNSRTFDTIATSAMHRRPVKIDLFYPSSSANGKPFTYGDFLDMYSSRMDYTLSRDSARKVSKDVAAMFAEYMKLDSAGQYLNYVTSIYPDLPLPRQRLPLIIYAAGMNGSSWENVLLFDSLCRQGYVVAAVSSVGLFPGFMSTAPDISEQVKDVLFTWQKVSEMPFIDTARVGLLSWSLGGTAITKAAMTEKSFKCLVSFDGTETHYYGLDSAWDIQFDQINVLEPAEPDSIKVPYLYLSSDRQKSDKMYSFTEYIGSEEKSVIKIGGATHEHFSSIIGIAAAVKPEEHIKDATLIAKIWSLTKNFFNAHLNPVSERD